MSRDGDRFDAEGDLTVPFRAPGWDLGRVRLQPAGRPLVMGIINLTPDSFWAGSRSTVPDAALDLAQRLADEGADLLDLGAESSRPGAAPVGVDEELARLLPVLRRLRTLTDLPLTVDTVRADTAIAALAEGADAINDISAGTHDPGLLPCVARAGAGLVLMHMRGTPATMQDAPSYGDVVGEVAAWLAERAAAAEAAGVAPGRIAVDPGLGFGKTPAHNLALLRGAAATAGGRPLLVGASRKSFIAAVAGSGGAGTMIDPGDRLPGSLAALAAAWRAGATVVRVHDVAASRQFLDVLAAIADV
ncbi:MAG: dihydropteroate synthase [bacterium]|nr:dihydropteroate synthase [bacterium]